MGGAGKDNDSQVSFKKALSLASELLIGLCALCVLGSIPHAAAASTNLINNASVETPDPSNLSLIHISEPTRH